MSADETNTTPVKGASMNRNRNLPMTQFVYSLTSGRMFRPKTKRGFSFSRVCDLCGESKYPICFSPKDPMVASAFFDNLIELTAGQRKDFDRFLLKKEQATLCWRHVMPKIQGNLVNGKEVGKLYESRLLARRRNLNLPDNTIQPTPPPPSLPKKERKEKKRVEVVEEVEVTEARPDGETEKRPRNRICDLCGGPALPFRVSPKDHLVAKEFFASLLEVSPEMRELTKVFLKHNRRVTLCMKHIPQGLARPERLKASKMPEMKKYDQHGNRTCDVCGDVASPFRLSPKDPLVARQFVDNLIEVTTEQLGRIDVLLTHNRRVTTCLKHITKVAKSISTKIVKKRKVEVQESAEKEDKKKKRGYDKKDDVAEKTPEEESTNEPVEESDSSVNSSLDEFLDIMSP